MNNVTIVRKTYEAVAVGDLQTVLDHLAETVVCQQASSLPYGGTYTGKSGFQAMGAAIFATWSGFQSTPEAFIASDDYVVVLATMTGVASGTGKPLDMPLAEVWRLREEKVIEIRPFYWDTQATRHVLTGTS